MLPLAEATDLVSPGLEANGAPGTVALSIALIGPEHGTRKELASVLGSLQCGTVLEYASYPELDEVPKLIELSYEVVMVDLDASPEYALDIVESICGQTSATVMVYSAQAEPEWMIRCMRAGAREFLAHPFTCASVAEALIRASARQPRSRSPKQTAGALSIFFGAKGGSGVTTLACNFALLLARESGSKTLLIDLDLPLGDVSLGLGIAATYSTRDALENSARLDSTFFAKLLVQHSPGFYVLPSPGIASATEASREAVQKLLAVARQNFDYVVIDAGARLNARELLLFEQDARFYLITLLGIPDLRNANRIITKFFSSPNSKLEIVLNRYAPASLGLDDSQITKALTRPAQWKIPEDSLNARKAQNTGTPLGLTDTAVSRAMLKMARACCGASEPTKKKTGFLAMFGR